MNPDLRFIYPQPGCYRWDALHPDGADPRRDDRPDTYEPARGDLPAMMVQAWVYDPDPDARFFGDPSEPMCSGHFPRGKCWPCHTDNDECPTLKDRPDLPLSACACPDMQEPKAHYGRVLDRMFREYDEAKASENPARGGTP